MNTFAVIRKTNNHITLYDRTKSNVTFSPIYDYAIENAVIEEKDGSLTITGDKIELDINFHKEFLKEEQIPLYFEKDIQYGRETLFGKKKPYIEGCIEFKERIKNFKYKSINYTITDYRSEE